MMQDWLTDEDVSKWLNKYDWDSSGDISFNEFQALVRTLALLSNKYDVQIYVYVNSALCWSQVIHCVGEWRGAARWEAGGV